MIRTTTSNLDGKEIEKYLGVVVGEAILGANIFKDIFGAVRDIVGGRAGAYENELSRARDIAFAEIEQEVYSPIPGIFNKLLESIINLFDFKNSLALNKFFAL